jgi:hypothetical protein
MSFHALESLPLFLPLISSRHRVTNCRQGESTLLEIDMELPEAKLE